MSNIKNLSTEVKRLSQSILVNKAKMKVSIDCLAMQGIDKETKQTIIYIPGLDISGYGENFEKAMQLLEFSIDEFCKYLINLSQNEIDNELLKLGWKHDVFKKKNYSRAFVDMKGNLKEFNSENIELLQLSY